MNDTKENLKFYACKIKEDFVSYMGNTNIDCVPVYEELEDGNRIIDTSKVKVNGVDEKSVWKNCHCNTSLRCKIAIGVFKHLTSFLSSSSLSKEFDYSGLLTDLVYCSSHDER